jgi:hypothetical protein
MDGGKSMEQAGDTFKDRRFLEMLCALRKLPPNTYLPQITAREDQKIFHQLLQLPDKINIFWWLQRHASKTVTRIALRILVLQLRDIRNSAILASSRAILDDYYPQLLGGFLKSPEEILPFARQEALENASDAENLLLQILHEMQALYSTAPVPDFQPRKGRNQEQDQIYADLLRLPAEIDPLQWLQNNHAQFTVKLVLSHLLGRFRVTHGVVATLPTIHVLKVNKTFQPMPALRVHIQDIIFKTEGFLVRANLDISPRKLPLAEDPAPTLFIWNGFDRVVDNLGYQYLTWAEEIHAGGAHFHSYQEQITIACYPSLAASSTTLTFFSQPMVLETEFIAQGHPLPSSDIQGNDFIWHISLGNQ